MNGEKGEDGDDLFEFLEQKRKEVVAMTQAAEIAREQAIQLLRLQRQARALEGMAYGEDGAMENDGSNRASEVLAPFASSPLADASLASASNRGAAAPDNFLAGSSQEWQMPARSSSLTREDRRRFGLDDTPPPSAEAGHMLRANIADDAALQREGPSEEQEAPSWSSLSVEDRKRFGLDSTDWNHSFRPSARQTALWQPEAAAAQRSFSHHPDVLWGNAGTPGPPSMAKTLAQLEAVGMMNSLADIEDSERKLARLKLAG